MDWPTCTYYPYLEVDPGAMSVDTMHTMHTRMRLAGPR